MFVLSLKKEYSGSSVSWNFGSNGVDPSDVDFAFLSLLAVTLLNDRIKRVVGHGRVVGLDIDCIRDGNRFCNMTQGRNLLCHDMLVTCNLRSVTRDLLVVVHRR